MIEKKRPPTFLLIVTGAAALAYCLITARFEHAIAASNAASRQFNAGIERTRVALERAGVYRRLESRVRADFAHVDIRQDLTTSMAALLRLSTEIGKRTGVVLDAVTAAPAAPLPPKNKMWVPAALTMRLRGNFRGLMAFVQELPRQRIVVRIDRVELASQTRLVATVHATLYRLTLKDV